MKKFYPPITITLIPCGMLATYSPLASNIAIVTELALLTVHMP